MVRSRFIVEVSEGKGSVTASIISELDTPSNYGNEAQEPEHDACEMVLCVIS